MVKDMPNYKVSDLIERFESTAKKLALLIIKDGALAYEDPRKLTLSVLSYARKIVGLKTET